MIKTLKIILFASVVTGCIQLDNKSEHKSEQETLLIASQKFNHLNQIDKIFKIYKDSSFVFVETIVEPNHNKTETFEGKVKIENDTIKFFPFQLKYNSAETAVLKNGFIEFINGDHQDRMKIESSSLMIKNNINFKNFRNYAVFTFNKNFANLPDEKKYTNYDLTTAELSRIDNILKNTFRGNKKLRKNSDYIKQVESVKDDRDQVLVFIHCFCEDSHIKESFQYYQTEMFDGGNCNVYIVLNLTTGRVETINIAGNA